MPNCLLQIDYSTVPGVRILPFTITLDAENSVLNPDIGENQRFCYEVQGIGADTSAYADLSHLVFTLCPDITEEEIVNITVYVDGVEQDVDFGEGGNVELMPPEDPDPTTGCPGLKFDFGLDKVDGIMQLCFELTTPYTVGPVPVCLKGGQAVATGLAVCGPVCEGPACGVTVYQTMDVCSAITVTPYAEMGDITVSCCGEPTIVAGSNSCLSSLPLSCTFTVLQNLCVEVPVNFGATATANASRVVCGGASDQVCDCSDGAPTAGLLRNARCR